MNIRNQKTIQGRRHNLEKELHVDLTHIGSFTFDEVAASSRNCENMIGAAQIPLGIAGPLLIKSMNDERRTATNYYIPLATTEGALVASVARGCKAISESGGATVNSFRLGATRGPVFHTTGYRENLKLFKFIQNNLPLFQSIASATSHHLILTEAISRIVGRYQFVRFAFNTQDAMGMNMVTIATEKVARYIEEKTGAVCLSISGNYCVDKKPSWQNFIRGRGFEVWAEVLLPKYSLRETLKTTAKQLYNIWLSKCMIGSAVSGSIGYNAQYANIIAALYLATGQDEAHVTEGSLGITTAEAQGDDLYISIYLPDLMVGTVGGGTGLATQKEALMILKVDGGNGGANSQKFAEIIGAAVLAGEISLLASLAEGTLARAHKTLGRGMEK